MSFETLSDTEKRRKYDSTIDFDDSYPSKDDIKTNEMFFTKFGATFKRNGYWSTV